MLALKARPSSTLIGSLNQACMPQPRIHKLRKGSPAPSTAPRWVVKFAASGHVSRNAAARYSPAARSSMSGVYGGSHQIGDEFRVALAPGLLHHLSDQELELAILAGANLRHDVAVRAHDAAHDRFEARAVGDLRQAFRRDDIAGGATGLVHLREHILGHR